MSIWMSEKDPLTLLNKHADLISKCHHGNKSTAKPSKCVISKFGWS